MGPDTMWLTPDVRQRRRSARRKAQIRRRRFVALVVFVIVLVLLALLAVNAARAGASAAVGAGAALVAAPGQSDGSLSVAPAVRDDSASVSNASRFGLVRYTDGAATVSSFLVGRALVSEADVSLSDVSLFGGLITARSISAVATASASTGSADASGDASYVSGLEVDGTPVDDSVGSVDVPGVGTLTVLEVSTSPAGSPPSATVTALRLVVDHDAQGLPAGSIVTVGRASATADQAAAAELLERARAQAGPSPLPEPTPKATTRPTGGSGKAVSTSGAGTSGEKSGKNDDQTGAAGGGGSRHRSSSGGAGGGSVNDSTMPPPAPPRKELLARFPGAVFPVKGPVDYSDTFGAYRADLKGHRHQGTDVFAAMGTPIVAVLGGTIEYSRQGIGGNNAHLTTPSGDYFYYAHMERFAEGLTSGDTVRKGQVIGYVGETGDAAGTSPHLHFEIHPDGGAAVDSYPYLEAWRAAAAGVPAAARSASSSDSGGADVASLNAGLPTATILARRGVITTLDLGTLGIITITRTVVHRDELPQPGTLETILFLASIGGVTAIRRLRRPELPELLAANETVVRQTVRIAERALTDS